MKSNLNSPEETGAGFSPIAPQAGDVEPIESQSAPEARLLLEDGTSLPLQAGSTLAGRLDPLEDVNCDLDLGLHSGFEKGVSRQHALFTRDEEGYGIEDVGSTNGTVVNRVRIQPRERHPVRNGDVIFLGALKVVFTTESR